MAFEGTTVRVFVNNVNHDVAGSVISGVDSATWVAYRGDGSEYLDGDLAYVPEFGWTDTFDTPSILDGLAEELLVIMAIVFSGDTQKWEVAIPVEDMTPVGV
jgi:hypothetical protein